MKNKRKIYNLEASPIPPTPCWSPITCKGKEGCKNACENLNKMGPAACKRFDDKEKIRMEIMNEIQKNCGTDILWENNFMGKIFELLDQLFDGQQTSN